MSQDAKYPWLSIQLPEMNAWQTKEANKYLQSINNKKDWINIYKEISAQTALEQIQSSSQSASILKKPLDRWPSLKIWKEQAKKTNASSMERFRIAGMVSVMSGTLVSFFLGAILYKTYVIGFSMDALVAAAAAAFLLRNLQIQYKIAGAYGMGNYWLVLWILAGLLCGLLKMILPPAFDGSLVVLCAAYFVAKKNLVKVQENILKAA